MALLKTKKVRNLLAGRKNQLKHKPRGMAQKEQENRRVRITNKTSTITKLRHGVRKNVGKKQTKKGFQQTNPEKKKELLKKKKEEEEEAEDVGADEGLESDAYYFPQEQVQFPFSFSKHLSSKLMKMMTLSSDNSISLSKTKRKKRGRTHT